MLVTQCERYLLKQKQHQSIELTKRFHLMKTHRFSYSICFVNSEFYRNPDCCVQGTTCDCRIIVGLSAVKLFKIISWKFRKELCRIKFYRFYFPWNVHIHSRETPSEMHILRAKRISLTLRAQWGIIVIVFVSFLCVSIEQRSRSTLFNDFISFHCLSIWVGGLLRIPFSSFYLA